MLSDKDIAKLCQGRIIYANAYRSSGKDEAGPHYAVILDSDEEVAKNDNYFAAFISHDQEDAVHIVPVPAYTGLTGFIQCSWVDVVHLPGIIRIVNQKILPLDMIKIFEMYRKFKGSKSTQS
jgi:hypothetical protein